MLFFSRYQKLFSSLHVSTKKSIISPSLIGFANFTNGIRSKSSYVASGGIAELWPRFLFVIENAEDKDFFVFSPPLLGLGKFRHAFLCLSQITNPSFIDLFLLLIIIKLLEFPFPSLNIDWVDSKLPLALLLGFSAVLLSLRMTASIFIFWCVVICTTQKQPDVLSLSLALSFTFFYRVALCDLSFFLCRDMRAYPIRVGEGKKRREGGWWVKTKEKKRRKGWKKWKKEGGAFFLVVRDRNKTRRSPSIFRARNRHLKHIQTTEKCSLSNKLLPRRLSKSTKSTRRPRRPSSKT